jgi:hypothetical protein
MTNEELAEMGVEELRDALSMYFRLTQAAAKRAIVRVQRRNSDRRASEIVANTFNIFAPTAKELCKRLGINPDA